MIEEVRDSIKLKGTEKQVKWAHDIIEKKRQWADNAIQKSVTDEEREKHEINKRNLEFLIELIDDAELWINHREHSYSHAVLINKVRKMIKEGKIKQKELQ